MVAFVIIILLLLIIGIIHFIINNYRFKYDTITFFEGSLGSGKTTIITREIIKNYRKRVLFNYLIANKFVVYFLSIVLFILPFVNIVWLVYCIKNKTFKVPIKKRGIIIYSTYPIKYRFCIFSKWHYSLCIDKRLFNWIFKVSEDCLIATDELGYIFPPDINNKGNAIMTDKQTTFGLTWLRHAVSPMVFAASQSIDEVNITFRRKVQHIYRLSNNKKVFWFISKVNAIEIQRSEDTGGIITTFNDSNKDYVDNVHYYIYPKYNFNSRYGRLLYNLSDIELSKVSYSYEYLLSKIGQEIGKPWKSLCYEVYD